MNTLLNNLTKNINIELTDSQIELFDGLYNRLVSENKKYNLTAITEKEKVALLHFYDSLTAVSLIKKDAMLCDIGSGGGFPALPLKIARPDINLTMIDSVTKKVNYLNTTCELFHLENAKALHTRIEDLAKTSARESFDVVTSRAVAKLPTLLEYALPLVKVGGFFIAYKTGDQEELDISQKALSVLGGKIKEVKNFTLENNDYTRSLIVVEKIIPTPISYPRGKNLERSNPIL